MLPPSWPPSRGMFSQLTRIGRIVFKKSNSIHHDVLAAIAAQSSEWLSPSSEDRVTDLAAACCMRYAEGYVHTRQDGPLSWRWSAAHHELHRPGRPERLFAALQSRTG